MDERHTAAAAAIIEGKSTVEAAIAARRIPETIYKWLEEPEFQAVVLRGIKARALMNLALYVSGHIDPKVGQAALAIMKWMGAGKPKTRGSKVEPEVEEETDIGEFSEDQLRRLKGEDA